MSNPPSIQAIFKACHPLRKCSAPTGPAFFGRTFHSTRPFRHPELTQPNLESTSVPLPPATTNAEPNAVAQSPKPEPDANPLRFPRAVQASYLKPLRHSSTYGVPVCTLQLRSFSVRNVEFMGDFAMRAAYYLGLPARGPSPLPRLRQRWTVLKSPFVMKKSQENFERVTLRRVVEIQDGNPEVVKIWLAYLRKYAFYGVGMKANVWEYESLDVAQNMDKAYEGIEKELDEKLSLFGWKKSIADQKSAVDALKSVGQRLPGVPMTEVFGSARTAKQPHLTEDVYRYKHK